MEDKKELVFFAISDAHLNDIVDILEELPYNKVYDMIEIINKLPRIHIQNQSEDRPSLNDGNS